jgi:hypothetical protein
MLRKTFKGRRHDLYSVESLKSITVINLFNFIVTTTTSIVTETQQWLAKVCRMFQFPGKLTIARFGLYRHVKENIVSPYLFAFKIFALITGTKTYLWILKLA